MNIKNSSNTASCGSVVMDRIADAIPGLPPALRKVVDYVLRHPMKTATMTIDDLTRETSTSPAAVNQLARVIDYGGFIGLKAELLAALRDVLSPVEKLKAHLGQCQSENMLQDLVRAGIGNLQALAEANSETTFNGAVEAIAHARRVYTLGFGNNGTLAAMAAVHLQPYFTAVIALGTEGGNEHAACRLTSIAPDDVLLAISLPRYSRDTVQLARFAAERGATVVTITDSPAAPLKQVSHHVLYAPAQHPLLASSNVATTLVIESLVAAVMTRNKEVVRITSDLTESILSYLYLDGQSSQRRTPVPFSTKSRKVKS